MKKNWLLICIFSVFGVGNADAGNFVLDGKRQYELKIRQPGVHTITVRPPRDTEITPDHGFTKNTYRMCRLLELESTAHGSVKLSISAEHPSKDYGCCVYQFLSVHRSTGRIYTALNVSVELGSDLNQFGCE